MKMTTQVSSTKPVQLDLPYRQHEAKLKDHKIAWIKDHEETPDYPSPLSTVQLPAGWSHEIITTIPRDLHVVRLSNEKGQAVIDVAWRYSQHSFYSDVRPAGEWDTGCAIL